jgi:hypothetical protein
MTLSIEIRGASHGFRENGRSYLAAPVVSGTQPAILAAMAPAPIVLSKSRRSCRFVVDIEMLPLEIIEAKVSALKLQKQICRGR